LASLRAPTPNNVRPAASVVDQIDRAILQVLAREGRLANNALAQRVGIAPSTCLGRVRALRESGVIRGFYADIAPEALGHPIQAVLAVRLQADARHAISEFAARVATLPHVLNVFFLAGADDFLIHVAAASTQDLRDFVVTLSRGTEVASTETNLIFEHIRGTAL
jgi:DNA-binding Lrp family transcriptional regulator